MLTFETIVICPDVGCSNCEHTEPHEFMNVESSCTEGGDNNCPHCEEYEKPVTDQIR